MERVFCVNRTEVNKSYSRSRAWRFATSRESRRKVVLPSVVSRSAVRFFSLRSFARSLSFYTRTVSPRTCVRISRIDRKLEIRRLRLFFALSLFLLVDITQPQPAKEKKSEATDQSLSINPDTCRSYAASTQTGAIASNGKRHFAGCQKYVIHPGKDAICG